jgi:transcriptional regulator GlxA family with amidase domain
LRAHAGRNTIMLSLCAGAKNLAATGLLDGRSATTHHYTFPEIAQEHPTVKLVRGVRYVEDGNVITSTGVTAGVDVTLYVLKRLLSSGAASGDGRARSAPQRHKGKRPSSRSARAIPLALLSWSQERPCTVPDERS